MKSQAEAASKPAKSKGKKRGGGNVRAPARARGGEHRAQARENDVRVRRIVDLMLDHKYDTGRTARELATEWKLSESRVIDLASQASRYIRMAFGSTDEIRTRIMLRLETATDLAENDPSPAQAARAIADCQMKLATISGAAAPIKVAQTTAAGDDVPAELRAAFTNAAIAKFCVNHDRFPTEAERAALLASEAK